MISRRWNGRWIGALALSLLLGAFAQASTWHVSPLGKDTADGLAATPFATLARAFEAAVAAGDACEIILHAGSYPGNVIVPAPASPAANPPAWVIRSATAAGGHEDVIIDGGLKISDAQVVDAARGIRFVPCVLANYEPSMWDARSRVRYPFVADLRSVQAFSGTLAPGRFKVDGEEKEGLFFRTSDGKPPAEHELGLARDPKGFIVQRPNVTVRGLRFQNFQLYFGSCGVSIEAANVTVESCDAWNCWGGYMVGEGTPDAKVLRCTALDVATGVKSYGKNTVVEDCRFVRVNDSFEVQEYEQDQCGIQFYSSNTQTARRNLCAGFNLGIFIKASGGVLILESNTVVAGPKGGERGIGPNTWRPGSICRGNVVVGYREPIALMTLNKDCTVTANLIWKSSPKALAETVEKIRTEAAGETVAAPPQFVDETREDFRLAPASAGAALGPNKQAVGALGVAPAGTAARPVAPEAPASQAAAPSGPAQLAGQPSIRVNQYGAVVLFRTDRPCTAAVEWGADGERLAQRVDDVETTPPSSEEDPAPAGAAKAILRTHHCLAMTAAVKPGGAYAFRILLNTGAGDGAPVHQARFTAQGQPRVLHVAATGVDDEAGGSPERPFATLQFAADRALPGDRVVVASGVYSGTVRVTHGGVAGQPIRLESAEPWGAVLDGKREAENAIRVGCVSRLPETWAAGCQGPAAVSHLRISGFEIRWYNGLCIRADESTDIVVEGCKFWSRHFVKGRPGICEGIGAYHCERVAIDHNLFFAVNTAVRFNQSVGLRLTHNTAARCFHRVIGIIGSKDLYLRNNSFAFGSSYLLAIHGVDMKTLDSDYNNFAVHLREDGMAAALKANVPIPPAEVLKREKGDFYYGESKALAAWDERTPDKPYPYLVTLTSWRQATGQDKHSIAIHPRYVDPRNRDFRLLPNSPNIGAGENGATIGALGVTQPNP